MSEFYSAARKAEREQAATPKDPVVMTRVRLMTEASRQGRALVSSRQPEPTVVGRPSSCRLERHQPKPRTGAYPRQAGERSPSEDRTANRARAAAIAEREEKAAIDRFRPFIQIASVRVTQPETRQPSPDHYGLRRHLERDKRQISPASN